MTADQFDLLGLPGVMEIVEPTYATEATIQERYEAWRDANEWVLPALARLLDDWSARGQRRVGVKAATEWLRFFYARQVETSDFRVNNSYTSRLARDLIERYPRLAAVIETREMRAS
jgi:hypothetical protein